MKIAVGNIIMDESGFSAGAEVGNVTYRDKLSGKVYEMNGVFTGLDGLPEVEDLSEAEQAELLRDVDGNQD